MATETIMDLGAKAKDIVETLLDKKVESIISVKRVNGGWKVLVEVLERKAIPDAQDLLGRYELKLGENEDLLEYERVVLRRRMDLDKEKWYAEEEE